MLLATIFLSSTAVRAEPIGRGDAVVLVTQGITAYCLRGTFVDQDYSAFGTNVNLGQVPKELVMWGDLPGAGKATIMADGYPDKTQLHLEGNLVFWLGDGVTFTAHKLDVVSGSAVQALSGVEYSLDGRIYYNLWDGRTTIPGCPYPGPYYGQYSGTISLNAFQKEVTPTGSDVVIDNTVAYHDVTTGTTTEVQVGVKFDEVYGAGSTTVTAVSSTSGTIPPAFAVEIPGLTATFFDVSTDAQFVGPIEICTNYDDKDNDGIVDGTDVPEGRLRLLHGEGDPRVFVDRTSRIDTEANLVCAEVPSLSFFVRAVSACGNGSVDTGEECDDGQSPPLGGDGCSATCKVEECFACSGSPSSCTPTTASCDDGNACTTGDVCSGGVCSGTGGTGTSCDDGNSCTSGDKCTAGVCAGTPLNGAPCDDGNACTSGDACSSGTCSGSALTCNDGNPCTTDSCSPSKGCLHGAVPCPVDSNPCTQDICLPAVGCGHFATPSSTCKQAGKSALKLLQSDDDSKDLLKWDWSKGAKTTLGEIADPQQTASYDLCIFQDGGIVESATLVPGGQCNGKACWSGGKSGFLFKDKAGAQNGITKMLVNSGDAGKAKASVQGKGGNLGDVALPLKGKVTVQLRNRATGACLGADYSGAQIQKNGTKGAFAAKAP